MGNLYQQTKALYSGKPDPGIVDAANNVAQYKAGVAAEKAPPAKPAAPAKPSPKDLVNPKGQYGDKPGEKRIDTSQMTRPLGSFKKGGKVKKTGTYKLHKGERVLNAKKTKKLAKMGGMGLLGGK